MMSPDPLTVLLGKKLRARPRAHLLISRKKKFFLLGLSFCPILVFSDCLFFFHLLFAFIISANLYFSFFLVFSVFFLQVVVVDDV